MSSYPLPDAPARPSPRQVMLGVFVLGQLVFLVLSHAIRFGPDAQPRVERDPALAAATHPGAPGYSGKSGYVWQISDEFSTLLRRWAQLTCQPQAWSLFAPNVYKVTGFPAVVLVWGDEPTAEPEFAGTLGRLRF